MQKTFCDCCRKKAKNSFRLLLINQYNTPTTFDLCEACYEKVYTFLKYELPTKEYEEDSDENNS